MFGSIGGPEMMLIFIVGLVVFGPRKLPELGKSLGKMVADFKRASADFQRTVEEEVHTEQLREHLSLTESPAPPPPPPDPTVVEAAPMIREAAGSVPSSNPLTSNADISGDKSSGTASEISKS